MSVGEIQISDISPRLMTIPIGTTLEVPQGHEWYITGVAVLPTRGYVPPLTGEARDARSWGDLQIRVHDRGPGDYFRANVLTLIDRYWGRFNLNPSLPDIAAKLTAAQQAMYTAPKLSDMYTLMDHLMIKYAQYLDTAAPRLEQPLQLNGGARFTIECVAPEGETVAEVLHDSELDADIKVKVLRALDVELSMLVKRPVS